MDRTENAWGVPNQYIIYCDNGDVVFKSYQSIIAIKRRGSILLDRDYWDYSKTTGKYRNKFLDEDKKITEKKIKCGVYALAKLN